MGDQSDKHLGGHIFVSDHKVSDRCRVTLIYDDEHIIKLNESQSRCLADFMCHHYPSRRRHAQMNWWQKLQLRVSECLKIWKDDA